MIADDTPCGLRYRSCEDRAYCRIKEVHKKTDAMRLDLILDFDPPMVVSVEDAFVREHDPQPGGYYVVSQSGWETYYPQEVFHASRQ